MAATLRLKRTSAVNRSSRLKKSLSNISSKSWMWNNLLRNIDGREWVLASFPLTFNLVSAVNPKTLFYVVVQILVPVGLADYLSSPVQSVVAACDVAWQLVCGKFSG